MCIAEVQAHDYPSGCPPREGKSSTQIKGVYIFEGAM